LGAPLVPIEGVALLVAPSVSLPPTIRESVMSRIEELVRELFLSGSITILEAVVIVEAFNSAYFDEEEVGKAILKKYVEMKG
jgi:hypothetical protein